MALHTPSIHYPITQYRIPESQNKTPVTRPMSLIVEMAKKRTRPHLRLKRLPIRVAAYLTLSVPVLLLSPYPKILRVRVLGTL